MSDLQDNGLSGFEIAVIGMAGRFPGAQSIHEFRENLENGQESISFFSEKELAAPRGMSGLQENPNYVKAKGIFADADCFDASFFNYTLPEAEMMDPQFRILHEFSWKALEDAGYNPETYEGYIGFYAGATTNLYWIARMLNRIKDPADRIGLASLNDNYSLSTQVAYRLNLKGPAVTVQTACSTSLVAIHHACQALLSGECDMALAGGVSIQLPVKSGYLFQEGMVFSSDGHCRAFDATADGTVAGDGVGIVVLKPLENALEEKDHIYAVIKGSAINNDGNRKVGYTAPSITGQAEVIRRAHQAADVEPTSITYVETHGTGTSLGDPVEIQALIQAFNGAKRQSCRIGSVKSNIGHLDSAAGVAGFIKAVLALYYKRIPPTLHFETPNPKIDFENSPFIVNTGLTDWEQGKSSLRAGVSSFGIGGTNAHVILEQRPEGTGGLAPLPIYQLILLSARTESALERMTANLVEFFKQNPNINLADVAYTLHVGRKAFEYRRTLVCQDVTEAVRALSTRDAKKVHTHLLKEENPPVVFMFPGLGSQYVNMGADLYKNEPVFRDEMDRCFKILKGLLDYDVKEILYPNPGCRGGSPCPPRDCAGSSGQGDQADRSYSSYMSNIHQIDIAQLLVFVIEYALFQLLIKRGIKPNAVIGYSFGEYAAACAAGIFPVEDALKLIVHRGELIRQTPAGAMLSVPLPREELMPLLTLAAPAWLAIDNGPSCIVSGTKTAVDDLEKQLKQKKLLCMRLDASYALHSPLMDCISGEFTARVREITLNEPQVPIISNVTGQWLTAEEAFDPSYWARHLQDTVQFAHGIRELVKEPQAVFVEIGPGRDLCALIQRCRGENHQVVNLIKPPTQEINDTAYLLDKLGRLWLYGNEINLKGFYYEQGEERYRVSLPTYSFEPQKFDIDQPSAVSPVSRISISPSTYKRTQLPGNYEAPGDEVEKRIAAGFQAIFGLDLVGIHDDFFELGGDSLKVITLVTRLHRDLGVEIPMDAVFKNPTVKEIAAYIRETQGQSMFAAIPPVEKKEYYPLAPPQRRMFIMDQLEEKNKAYNMPSVLWLEGPVDIPLLEEACRRLLERHESLRTGFFLEKGEPVQRVYPAQEIETPFEYNEKLLRGSPDASRGGFLEKSPSGRRRQEKTEKGTNEIHNEINEILENFIRPFDLFRPPLWRIGLVRVELEKHLLIQNIHHIISDDISIGVMITELAMLLRGELESLAPLPVQYKDYAVWQWEAAADRILQEQTAFWLDRFPDAGELPVLEMPYDFSRPPVQTFDGAGIELKLELKFRDQLLELARNHKTTLFVVLFTAYNFLLHSYSGQEDIIVGTPITGRSHRDVQQVVGMFVNTLSMRTYPTDDKTFAGFLEEVKEETLAAFAHQLYPFEDLVEQLDIPRDISRNPLFDTMFVLHTVDLEMVTIPGVKLSPYEFDRRVSKFDITLNAAETKSSLTLELEYNTALFKAETMQHFIKDYVFILDSISANPALKPGEIQTYPLKRKQEEKKQVLYEFNQTEVDFPGDKPLHRFFEEQAEKTPDNTAVVGPAELEYRSHRSYRSYISYRELSAKSDQLAQSLKEKGVGSDTIVGIMMERCPDMVTGILGILKSGGAYLPIDPDYPEERIRYMLEDSKVKFLVKKSNKFIKIEIVDYQREKHKTSVLSVSSVAKKNHLHLSPSPGTCLAYILYTSGSTGKPKGVMVQHRSVVNILYALSKEYPLLETDTYLLKTSVLFDVSVTELLGWFWRGGRLAVLEKDGEIDPGLILDTIRRYHVTHINFVPSLFTVFVDHLTPQNMSQLSTLKYIFLAGEALLPHPVEKFIHLVPGIALENIYGPTEATIYASGYSLRDWQVSEEPGTVESIIGVTNRKIPIGKPLPNVKLYILDKFDRLQSIGAAGELCISGVGLARGYLNKPEMTFEKFCPRRPGGRFLKKLPREASGLPRKNFSLGVLGTGFGFGDGFYWSYRSYRSYIYRTGDLARWLGDGNIEFLGRLDHQVKIRGNRIELGEIECYLLKHSEIKEAVVLVREDESKEKTLWAYIVSGREFEKGELRQFLAGDLPDYMIPSYFIRISRMPYTSGGKIDRKVLLKVEGLQSKPGVDFAAPGTELEKTIAETWKDELKLDRVGIDDNFLDLGGTSLKIIRVMSRLREHLKKEIPVVTLFRYPTIRSLASYLTRSETPASSKDRTNIKSPIKSFYGGSRGAVFSKRAPLAAGGKDIAVIGMSCRFPGAGDIEQFWSNLKNGIETISFFSEQELAEAGVDREQLSHPGYVKAMGFLEGMKEFDAGFFDYVPVEAEVMDPQVRLFHEVTWEALEDAGYVPEAYGGLIGLYAGASESFYWKTLAVTSGKIDILGAFELDKLANKDYLCARTAYKLNLKGPVVFVQTACSTSLVAIHMACRGILSGEADMALAGGVSIMQYKAGYIYQEGMIQTPDGHCRAFDDHAEGTLAGSGLGVVVLKPLPEAAADRDHIYAVIRGTAINNDGMQKIGFTAPSVEQQAGVISSALQNAGMEVESIGYVEAHGTGTMLGDPVEIEALKLAFNASRRGFCAIGSVKTNFGHLDSAAGVAGFIKAVLALKHKQIPPSLHFETPNSKIDFIDSPFYMSTGLQTWRNGNGLSPRRAGVSSLGLGGTNVHVILEEAPETDDRRQMTGDGGQGQGRGGVSPPAQSRQSQLILLSAKTESALERMTQNLAAYLKENPGINLADVAYTLQTGRKAFKYRRAVAGSTTGEVAAVLSVPGKKAKDFGLFQETAEAWLSGKEIDWSVFYRENNQKPRRISLPTYPFEGRSYWLEGNSFKMEANLSLKKSSIDKKPDIADWFYIPSWKRVSSLPLPGNESSVNNCCMVFADEGGAGVKVVKSLEQMKQEVITVTAGNGFAKIGDRVYTVNPRHRSDYEELFETLVKAGMVPGKIFHLWSLYQGNRAEMGEISVENFNGFQYKGFYSLVFLASAVDKLGSTREIEIVIVTSNTQNVIGDDLLYPESAAILGAVKVIPQEYPDMICRHIDVDSRSQGEHEQELVNQLTAEYFSGTREPVVAFRGRSRWAQDFEPLPLESSLEPVPRLRKRGVYLITGGFGNIGFTLAKYLARSVQARLILVGRSPVPDQTQPGSCHGSSKVLKIKQLEQLGGEVLALSADVSNPEQMAAVAVQAEEHFGLINGVFHAAGDTGDSIVCTIEHLREEQIQSQFRARVFGLMVLDRIFKHRQKELDFCLVVSSLVSVLGGLGFAAYTAAMSVMDAYIHFHNRESTADWISVNTAEWLFGGEESRLHTVFPGAETVKLAMTEEQGLETFARILSHGSDSQVIISTGDLQARIDKWVKLQSLREDEQVHKSDKPSLPSLHGRPDLPGAYVSPVNPVQQAMVDMWQTFFGIEPIGIEDDFFRLGGDSLKAITILSKIHKELAIKLTIEEFFKYPNIKELSGLVGKSRSQSEKLYRSIEPVEKREYYKLSSAQERLYLIQQMNPGSTGYNIPLVLPIGKDIEKDKLERIFKQLIARHESLRTSFITLGDEPVQRVHDGVAFEIENYKIQNTNYKLQNTNKEEPFRQVLNACGGEEGSKNSEGTRGLTSLFSKDFIRPFDLSHAPLMRSGLIPLPDGSYHWLVDMHHIVSDGISQAVLTGDFIALYNGEVLEPLLLHYKDFSRWQQRLFTSGGIKGQEDYWLKLYADAREIPRLDLPTDASRPGVFTFAGDHYGFSLEGEDMVRFRELGSRNGATLFMSLMAVLNVLFYKYTGQTDIIIGSGTAGRGQSDLQGIIGMFVNTLAVRNFPRGEKTFAAVLKEVSQNSLKAFENQDLQFEALVERLDLGRNPSRNPLFDICLVVQNFLEPLKNQPSPFLINENLVTGGYKNPSSRFDMTFFIHELARGIYIDIEYYTGIFTEGTIRRLVSHFNQLLKVIIHDPSIQLQDIDMVTPGEKQQLLEEFNDTASAYPRDKTIHELFALRAAKTPHHAAVVYEEETITYSELNRRSDRLAAYLFSNGVNCGDAVGIMIDRCLEMIISTLAILKTNGCYLPINREYPHTRRSYLLEDSSAGILLVKGQKINYPGILTIDLQEPFILNEVKQQTLRCKANDLAYIMYTSGSTGNPKGVMVEHRSVVRLVKNTNYIELGSNDRLLQTGVLEFDASTFEVWGALLNGLTLCLQETEKILAAHQMKAIVQKYNISVMWMTAPLFNQMLDADIGIFTGLRYLLVGGDMLSPFHINRLKQRFPHLQVINGYGPTENTTFSTTYLIDKEYSENIPIGKPIANSTAFIINKNGQLQPIGIVGELCVAGVGLARGYLNNPELTNQKFLQGGPGGAVFSKSAPPDRRRLYKTGDLARWLPDGNIQFVGRSDQQVKIRGFRVEPGEIERHLNRHQQINESVVVTIEEKGEKYLCAYVVCNQDYLDKTRLKDFLADRLPGFMMPAFFVQLDKIPLTTNGKVDRKALPAPILETGNRYIPPGNNTERKLVEIWSEILQLPSFPGIDDNFFELGGHSLKATLLISKIHKELGVKVPLVEIFRNQTVRMQAEYLKQAKYTRYAGIDPVEKREYYKLSSAQKRLYFLQQLDLQSITYNMPLVLPLDKDIEIEKLESTVKKLIARHESLRTSFIMSGDKPVQRVHNEVSFEIENYKIQNTMPLSILSSEFVRPFDLSQAPLIRCGIIEMPGRDCTLLVDLHHIISDGTSQTILSEDFSILYNSEALAPLRLQYKDFSRWQDHLIASGGVKDQEDYWQGIYSDTPGIPRLNLLTDYKRPRVFSFAGDRYEFILEEEASEKFKALALKNQVTLYMNMLAAVNTLFYKYTGQADIIIGCGIAGRPHADLQQIIGMFVNTLAMRNYPCAEKTYEDLLKEVSENSLKAFENQDLQFEELVDRLELERDPSRNPLFDISMVVQNFRDVGKGIRISRREMPPPGQVEEVPAFDINHLDPVYRNPTTKFDLTFFIHEQKENIHISLEYYTAIFKSHTIQRLASHLENIIKTIIAAPCIRLKDIEMISREEKQQVLYGFNTSGVKFDLDRPIHVLFEQQVEKTPDNVALVEQIPGGGHSRGVEGTEGLVTYKHLNRVSNRLARYLARGKGVKPGDAVGILLSPSLHRPISIIGVLKAGAVYVPFDPDAPLERIKYMINDAAVGTVISEKKFLGPLNWLQWECSSLHTYLCLDSHDIHEEEEAEKSELMDQELWHHVGETAVDDITGGGWTSSYTGEPLSRQEMDEYADNVLKKLQPLLHPKMRVLEIGCASGISMFRIAPQVALYYGTDLSRVIIEMNKEKIGKQGLGSIKLANLAAHEVHQLKDRQHPFDLVIINSVIQCFHGHNYLRKVIKTAIDLLGEKGYLFIGDVMDQDKKQAMIRELTAFKQAHRSIDRNYSTKTDFSSELFVAKGFFTDLAVELEEIENVEFTGKIYTIENELTKFRYDTLIVINKTRETTISPSTPGKKWQRQKEKCQDDLQVLSHFDSEPLHLDIPSTSPAYIIYTSGTTGQPRGVVIEHSSLVNLCCWHNRVFQVSVQDNATLYAGFAFDASVWELFPYIIIGASILIIPGTIKLDIDALNDYYERHHITISFLPTQMCEQFMEKDNRSLRVLLTGGDKLRRFIKKGVAPPTHSRSDRCRSFGHHLKKDCFFCVLLQDINKKNYDLYNNYGPTENTVVTTYYPVEQSLDNIPIGKPVDNVRIYILEKESRVPLPVGIGGELCISGTGLARGYLNQPELTAEKFCLRRPGGATPFFEKTAPVKHPDAPRKNFSLDLSGKYLMQSCNHAAMQLSPIYRTGDLARWLSDGNIQFLGRIDLQVKIRGFRIELGEIEKQLLQHDLVRDAVVIDQEKENGEKYLCAYVVGEELLELSELKDHLSPYLPRYMIPAYFIKVVKIPLTRSGKPDRRVMPVPEITTAENYAAPRDRLEKKLVEIWAEILSRDASHASQLRSSLGIDENFFQLGGHSLKATILTAKIHKELRIKVPLAEVFKNQTIRGLAQIIRNSPGETFTEIEPLAEKEYYELSFNQKRLWIIQQRDPLDNSYHMMGMIMMNRPVEEKLIKQTVQTLIQRHESLRTGFKLVEGSTVQYVVRKDNLPSPPLDTMDITPLEESQKQDRAKTLLAEFNNRLFHLDEPPLFRCLLIKVKRDLYVFAYGMHHIVSDGWSMQILERDFHHIYNTYLNKSNMELFPAKVNYKDFAHWHNRQSEKAAVKGESREFWTRFLKGELPPLRLPVDFDKGAGSKTKSGAGFRFVVPGSIKDALKTICSQHHITLFTLMYSLYNIWLARVSGQVTVVSSAVNAGRQHPSLQDLVGFFVNSVIFRIEIKEDDVFIDFVKEVGETVLEFFRHQNYPLELVLDEVGIKYPEVAASFNMLNIGNNETVPLENPDSFHNETIQNVKFDIEPYITEYSNGIEIAVNYNKNLFKSGNIEYMLGKYRQLIEFFALNPDKPIKDYKETKKRRSFKKG